MKNLLEQKRIEALNKTRKNSIIIIVTCIVLALLAIVLIYNGAKFLFVVSAISLIVMINYIIRYNACIKEIDDVTISSLYKKMLKYDYSYYRIAQEISDEMQYSCLFEENNIYITENWLIDLSSKDIKVINLDELIWVYVVVIEHNSNYIECYLNDKIRYSITILRASKAVHIIMKQRPNILYGYNNKFETLLDKNQDEFISNIQKGLFPQSDGSWLDNNTKVEQTLIPKSRGI